MDINQLNDSLAMDLSAAGVGSAINVSDYNFISATLSSSNTPSGTIRFKVSLQETMPNFSAAASPTNRWAYVQVVDTNDNTSISGSTGVAISSASVKILDINVDNVRWICPEVTTYVSGNFKVHISAYAK